MPVLTLRTDHWGTPVVNLYVGVGLAKSGFLQDCGLPIPVAQNLRALVDTGASRIVVEEQYLNRLDLSPLTD